MNNTQNRLLASILVLQVLILAGQWTGSSLPVAQAQVPDAGAQRITMIEELRASNAKLEKMVNILQSGKLQVQVVQPDKAQ